MAVPVRDWLTKPPDTDPVAAGAREIRELREDILQRLEREHVLNPNDRTLDGYHKMGSAVVYVGENAPTVTPDGTALSTALGSPDEGRLWKEIGGPLRVLSRATPGAAALTWESSIGANELYPMDQGVRTTDDVTFNTVTISSLGSRTYTTRNITGVGTSFTVPPGVFQAFILSTGAQASLDYRHSGDAWISMGSVGEAQDRGNGFFVISDGSNVRVRITFGGGIAEIRLISLLP